MWNKSNSFIVGEMQSGTTALKACQPLTKLNLLVCYDQTVMLLEYLSKGGNKYPLTQMLRDLFITARTWKQSRCPPGDE